MSGDPVGADAESSDPSGVDASSADPAGVDAVRADPGARPEAPRRNRHRARRRLLLAGRYLLLTALALVIGFPIYITVVNSLLQPEQIASRPPTLFPTDPDWSSYSTAWNQGNLGRYLLNSFVVTTVIVVGQVVTSVLAAYAFAFLEFPFRRALFVFFLATMMVPFEVTFFTNQATIVELGWYDTYLALTVPFLATGFGAFLIRQSFLALPPQLRDAAELDGVGHWRFLTRVAVPLARPGIAALALFSFFGAFNQYLWPLIVTRDERLRTVQIGLRFLRNTQVDQINVTFAGTVLAALPLFVLLILFQKQLVRGLTAGAVKG
ncbi:MAG: carbohydrate ABC transporter permease [Acidimicrobiales bacterium]|jgi:sn-glycerol 3-phosphate transport system permease protein|nr:carbohydrate ABC transporter permease [Acidimicrobiales bacterium]HMS87494.1 carbohydrate ABC transporter permease [Acidimicrobiales bacterium]